MSPTTPQPKLESLLEHLGSHEVPGDPAHRYALRRALLNSSCFEANRQSMAWDRFVAFAGTAFAGGFAVVVVLVAAGMVGDVSVPLPAMSSTSVPVAEAVVPAPLLAGLDVELVSAGVQPTLAEVTVAAPAVAMEEPPQEESTIQPVSRLVDLLRSASVVPAMQ